jgi:hypothetical protein
MKSMVEKTYKQKDESRRTFLKALGATGAATAGLSTLSDNAAASTTSTKTPMNALDIISDDVIPANKYLSITLLDRTINEIEKAEVLVNKTPISSVQSTGRNTLLLSVFDVLTNTNLTGSETVPVEVQAVTTNGDSLVGTDTANVIDPTNVLDEVGSVTDITDSTDIVNGATDTVSDTVDSAGLLSELSTDSAQSQMY